MEILLHVSTIALILVPRASVGVGDSSTALETIYPIQFTEVTSLAYAYTNILSQTYVEPYILDEDQVTRLITDAFSTPVRCRGTEKDCKETTKVSEMLQESAQDLVMREAKSVLFELRHDINGVIRQKRGFGGWVGTVLRTWCDVALQDDLNELKEADGIARTRISSILETMKMQQENFQNISSNFKEDLEHTVQELVNLSDRETIRSALRNQLTYLIVHYEKIHDSCNRRVIPSNSIDMDTLRSDLTKIQATLNLNSLTLAIPLESIQDYYKLRICTCQFSDDGIRMTIHFPLKPRDASYKLHSPIYLPFKFEDQICSIQAHEAILIENTNNKKIHVSSMQYLKDCDLSTHLCKLHPYHNSNMDSLCLHETFLSKPITELRDLCPFVCTSIPVDRPLINRLKPDQYVITNMPKNTFVESSDGVRHELPYSNRDGALLLNLSCSSRLVRTVQLNASTSVSHTLIDKVIPCSDNEGPPTTATHVLKPIIPVQWLKNSTSIASILNRQWKNFTPTYSFLTENEMISRINAISNIGTPKVRASDSSFTSYELTDKIYFSTHAECLDRNRLCHQRVYDSKRKLCGTTFGSDCANKEGRESNGRKIKFQPEASASERFGVALDRPPIMIFMAQLPYFLMSI